ncbi:hypothetical protein EDD29_1348 [Actinocorallia herbida]|uniref:Basic secretory peptidase family protein n=1 Tax=Actinocorallia herbida TaxID=58109 RepID=A0A3N1CRA7_9ACTN|nr:hypothetical protein [Actinocorallia herbida]ROO83839.1 hypothetical protein EDD29_1348 [Actinocorallia herbida]
MESDAPGPSRVRTRRAVLRAGALTAAAGLLAGCRADPAPTATDPATGAVKALLEARSAAVLAKDKPAFLAAVDPAEPGFLARQEELFAVLAALPLASWRETVESFDGTLARVRTAHSYAGFDTAEVVRTAYLRVGPSGLTGDGGDGHADDPQIWSRGPVTAVRGESCLVVGAGPLDQVAAGLDRAAPAVTAVVGRDWARKAVALVPVDGEHARALAGDRDLAEIAALAAAPQNADGSPPPARILVSPEAWPRLSALGRRVVLTHELTHIAVDAASDTTTPLWLVEGFADYVGYLDSGAADRAAAAELAREVKAGKLPSALPGHDAFAGSSPRLSQSYQEAWLACRMIAETHGRDKLVALYRAARTRPEQDALRDVLGTADIVPAWRSYLRAHLS